MSNQNIRVDAIGLAAEVVELRNEIARLKNQTNWVCKCGGTDCEGQKENAELRAHAERVGEANDRLVVENDALRKELDWKTERLKLLSDCLHKIDGFLKQAATSVFVDALDAARKEAQP